LTEIESDKDYINNTITIGTGLFELYLALQTIVRYRGPYRKNQQRQQGAHFCHLLEGGNISGLIGEGR
jgi:hypothetical protein